MPGIPSPILIFGDNYLSKSNILAAKKKYSSARWVTKSASDDTLNDIRMEVGLASWDDTEKIILINDLPNRKQVRDFLLDLSSSCSSSKPTKVIIWDSNGYIKLNTKTQTLDKTWGDFVKDFRKIPGSKVINNGPALDEKQQGNTVSFVVDCFEKHGRKISNGLAKLVIDIVGYERGMLDSDIKKMCVIAPVNITADFILENAFPSSEEAVQYKLANIIDSGSYENAINMMERFLDSGTNANVIAEICVRKARWQMVAAYLWVSGLDWFSISEKMMEMGRFPSLTWHNPNVTSSQKKMFADQYQSPDNMYLYMTKEMGLVKRHFKRTNNDKNTKKKTATKTLSRKGAEIIPMPFMAEQIVQFVRENIVAANKITTVEQKQKFLTRSIRVYLMTQEKLAEVRYGQNPIQDLQEMVKVLTNVNLECF